MRQKFSSNEDVEDDGQQGGSRSSGSACSTLAGCCAFDRSFLYMQGIVRRLSEKRGRPPQLDCLEEESKHSVEVSDFERVDLVQQRGGLWQPFCMESLLQPAGGGTAQQHFLLLACFVLLQLLWLLKR